jgi:hypothetical protein
VEVSDLLKKITGDFDSLGISYFITGSIASIVYGEPRFTHDIDIVADLSEKDIGPLQKCFPEEEFYFDRDAVNKAIQRNSQFNIIHPASGLKVDVFIPKKSQYDEGRFQRSKRLLISEEQNASFASPEDVVIMKLRYYRDGGSDKHLRDIGSILDISREMLDFNYIENWAKRLGLIEIWDKIL